MDEILAFGPPAIAAIVVIVGMLSIRHSSKVLKRKLADERAAQSTQGSGSANLMMPGYGEVHVRVGEPVDA